MSMSWWSKCVLLAFLGVATFSAAEGQVITFVSFYTQGFDGVTGILGSRSIAVSPDGKNVYASGETGHSLAVFSRDPATGLLTQVQSLVDGVNGIDGLMGAQVIDVSGDGKFVYVSATFEAAISVFSRDSATGLLTQVQVLREGVDAPDGMTSTIWVKLSRDGKNLYSASVADSAVIVWKRHRGTGRLTFRQILKDGVDGVDSIGGAFGIAISANGKQVYVTGLGNNSVTVFSRTKAWGDLSQVQALTDGIAGVDGLASARNIILSNNGKQAYVTGIADNAVSVFQVDRMTGMLTQSQVIKDGVGGADGLLMATGVALSLDQRYVFTAGFAENKIGVYSRDTTTGSLTFVRSVVNLVDTPGGLRRVIDFAATRKGSEPGCGHLYSTAFNSASVTVFSFDDCI